MTLLYILIAIVAIVIIVLVVLPSKIHVERSIMVKAPISDVFDQVNDLKKWENWSAWHKMDPDQKTEFSEPANGTGAWQTWESKNKNVGKGKMTIKESQENKRIILGLEFEKWGDNTSYYDFEETNDQVQVTMWMDTELKGFTKIFGPMMKSNLIKQFDSSLQDIRSTCEMADGS